MQQICYYCKQIDGEIIKHPISGEIQSICKDCKDMINLTIKERKKIGFFVYLRHFGTPFFIFCAIISLFFNYKVSLFLIIITILIQVTSYLFIEYHIKKKDGKLEKIKNEIYKK